MANLIIAAAGNGSRFSKKKPKQFVKILEKEILEMNIFKWLNIKLINKIYLVLPQMEFEYNKNKYKKLSNKIIPIVGGDSRVESINHAVKVVDNNDLITLIHDGVRPFFTEDLVIRILNSLKENNAVIPANKITDSVKKINYNKIIETVNREELVTVQTPQGFRTNIIKKAYNNINIQNSNFDDSELIEAIGIDVFWIEGEKTNIKITTKDDLIYAKFLMKSKY